MFDWTDFDTVFQQNPNFFYDTKTVEQIRKRRREFDGKLFVDRILESIGLKNGESSLIQTLSSKPSP